MSASVTTSGSSNVLRGIGAVLAGLVFIFVTHTVTDIIMHATGVFPPWFTPMSNNMWFVPLAYRSGFSILGCYLTARLAPNRPMFHSMILGAIGAVLSIVGVGMIWNQGPEYGPKWYAVALIFVALPCAWIGGWLRERQLVNRS